MPSAALLDQCSAQGDPRQAWKVVHPRPDVLLVVLCGTPAGGQNFVEIRHGAGHRLDFLRRPLPFARGIPSHDTLNDVMNALDPRSFAECFTAWVAGLRDADPDFVAIDGKTARRARRGDGTPFARLKVAQLALKVEAQRLALDASKRRLVDVAEADATIDEVAGAMRDALPKWPARVAGVIAAELGVDPHLRQTIPQQHVTDLLTEAANRFDPPGLGDRPADGMPRQP
jgi:hypothetical protein